MSSSPTDIPQEGISTAPSGRDIATTSAITTTQQQVAAALSDNQSIIDFYRQRSGLDDPTEGIENIDDLQILENALIGYHGFLVTLRSSEENLRNALNQDGISLGELVEIELSKNPGGNTREIIAQLLGRLEKAVIDWRREKIYREYDILRRIRAVAQGEGGSASGKRMPRNGEIRFYYKESEDIIREHFPEFAVYIKEI